MSKETQVTEGEYPEKTPVPMGREYGIFNGMLQLLDEKEVIDKYGMPFEEMREGYRIGVGLFKLPPEWLPKEGEENGTARWRTECNSHGTYYYYDSNDFLKVTG